MKSIILKIIFLSLFFDLIQSFKLYGDHLCNSLERSSKVFDSSSPEEMASLRKKNKKNNVQDKRDQSYKPFSIELSPGFGLQRYTQVSSSFLQAKNIWEILLSDGNEISDPINIFIDVQRLSSGVLGATESVRIIGNCIEPGGVFPEPMWSKTGISFPDCSRMQFKLPEGATWDGKFTYEKPHMKILGYSNLDYLFGSSDGQIIFSISYLSRYDFDISDGVSYDQIDFLSVAVHEIGHLLGFGSSIDDVDYSLGHEKEILFRPTILDVFRFSGGGGEIITPPPSFETGERYSIPDSSAQIFSSPLDPELCKFSTGMNHGDGNQASHWKDDLLLSPSEKKTIGTIGIMDPSLSRGIHIPISVSDVYAFRSIGYKVNSTVPIEVLNYEMKRINNYQKLIISAEFVFSEIMFIHFLNEKIEVADYNCVFRKDDNRWICPYPRSNLCNFRLSTTVGKVSRKVSLSGCG